LSMYLVNRLGITLTDDSGSVHIGLVELCPKKERNE
jgi:hypothetical protein